MTQKVYRLMNELQRAIDEISAKSNASIKLGENDRSVIVALLEEATAKNGRVNQELTSVRQEFAIAAKTVFELQNENTTLSNMLEELRVEHDKLCENVPQDLSAEYDAIVKENVVLKEQNETLTLA